MTQSGPFGTGSNSSCDHFPKDFIFGVSLMAGDHWIPLKKSQYHEKGNHQEVALLALMNPLRVIWETLKLLLINRTMQAAEFH